MFKYKESFRHCQRRGGLFEKWPKLREFQVVFTLQVLARTTLNFVFRRETVVASVETSQ